MNDALLTKIASNCEKLSFSVSSEQSYIWNFLAFIMSLSKLRRLTLNFSIREVQTILENLAKICQLSLISLRINLNGYYKEIKDMDSFYYLIKNNKILEWASFRTPKVIIEKKIFYNNKNTNLVLVVVYHFGCYMSFLASYFRSMNQYYVV